MNFEDEFGQKVIENFCAEYLAGRTPNPCIVCNREIKFGSLLRKSLALEAEFIATGHYARVERQEDGSFALKMGLDHSKDQSYALYQLDQFQLAHTLFPLGVLQKSRVREIAREAGLVTAERPESQEICFVADGHYSEFVAGRAGAPGTAGSFRLVSGEWIGPHRGIHRYTVGQRKGLELPIGHQRPLYVTKIDSDSGTVWIGEEEQLYSDSLSAAQVSYVSGRPFERPRPVEAKIRYNSPQVEAVAASLEGGRLRVDFRRPQKAITPGQAVVLYDGDSVLGGGTIE